MCHNTRSPTKATKWTSWQTCITDSASLWLWSLLTLRQLHRASKNTWRQITIFSLRFWLEIWCLRREMRSLSNSGAKNSMPWSQLMCLPEALISLKLTWLSTLMCPIRHSVGSRLLTVLTIFTEWAELAGLELMDWLWLYVQMRLTKA